MGKRFLSLFLAIVMVLSLGTIAFAIEDTPVTSIDNSAMTVEGTNDVGILLADELSGKTAANEADKNHITELSIEDCVATVNYVTDKSGDIVVAIYDETTGQMLASGTESVQASSQSVAVTINGDIPRAFVATAFLLDSSGHEPLCEEYTTTLYTSAMQDIQNSTTNDFDANRVLDLDGDPNANFLIYAEGTTVIQENAATNTITNNDDGTYTITNADNTFISLEAGDVFSYTFDDGTVLLVKVAAIAIDGTTVTIIEDENVSLEDFFDIVKIEVGSDVDEEAERGIAPMAFDMDQSLKKSLSIEIEDDDIGVSVKGTLETKIQFKLYLSRSSKYVELTMKNKIETAISVKDKLPLDEWEIGTPEFHPFAGLSIAAKIKLSLEVSGKFQFAVSISGKTGYAYDNGQFIDKSSALELNGDLKAEGKVELGLSAAPYIDILKGIGKISTEFKESVEITASLSFFDTSDNSSHDCKECIQGEISNKLSWSVNLAGFWGALSAKWEIIGVTTKLGDFYCSVDFNEFGWGKCPYINYKVTLTVLDKNDTPIQGASVTGLELEEPLTTSENGVVNFYLPNGTYDVTISYKACELTENIVIESMPRVIQATLSTIVEQDIIASGDCGVDGDNVKWTLTADGLMSVYGSGDMACFTEFSVPWMEYRDQITAVAIGNGVTNVGEWAFFQCANLNSVTIGNSVTSIDEHAFGWCEKLSTVTIGDSVTTIKSRAFWLCDSLTSVLIPSNVTDIISQSFACCYNLTEINVAEGNTTYRSENGVLISIDSAEIVAYPAGKTGAYTIPDGITGIGMCAFIGCQSLTGVTIPNSVTHIDTGAFSGCINLTSVTIGSGVTSIEDVAFENCNSLTSITIPANVAYMGGQMFKKCDGLKNVTILNPDCTILAFYGTNIPKNVTIYGYGGSSAEDIVNDRNNNGYNYTFISLGAASLSSETRILKVGEVRTPSENMLEENEITLPDEVSVPKETPFTEESSVLREAPTAEKTENMQPADSENEQTIVEEKINPLSASQQEKRNPFHLVSAFTGGTDGQTALFSGLMAGEDYAIIVVLNPAAAQLLASDNLLYIAQMAADDSGKIALSYIPRSSGLASVRAYGPNCEHIWSEGTVIISPTCTNPGERTYTCSSCGAIKTEIVPPMGHVWDDGKEAEKSNDSQKIEKIYTCTVCGETKTEYISLTEGASPDTYDGANIGLYASIMLLSAITLFFAIKRRKAIK